MRNCWGKIWIFALPLKSDIGAEQDPTCDDGGGDQKASTRARARARRSAELEVQDAVFALCPIGSKSCAIRQEGGGFEVGSLPMHEFQD